MTIGRNHLTSARSICLFLLLLCLGGCEAGDAPTENFRVASQGLLSAALSENGDYQFIGTFNHGGSLWNTQNHERLFDWNHQTDDYSAIQAAIFTADNRYAVSAAGDSLSVWSVEEGTSLRFWQSPTRIISMDVSREADYALLGLEDNRVVLFNLTVGGVVGSLRHEASISSVAMDDQAEVAITASTDGQVKLWSLASGQTTQTLDFQSPIALVQLSGDGHKALIAVRGGAVGIWDTASGLQTQEIYRNNPGITSALFVRDEPHLLIGTNRERVDLWDTSKGERLRRWHLSSDGPWHRAAVLALAPAGSQQAYWVTASDGLMYLLK